MSYLEKKDCAKILYDLYDNVFNRLPYEPLYCETEITEEQIEYSLSARVSKEEIWAYDNKIIYVSDEFFANRLEQISTRKLQKITFLVYTCCPACQAKEQKSIIDIEDWEKLSVEYGFLKGVFDCSLNEWIDSDEFITLKEAEKIAENIKSFFVYNLIIKLPEVPTGSIFCIKIKKKQILFV